VDGRRSVSILQGFSGIGKSWTAAKWSSERAVQSLVISVPEGSLGTFDLLFEIAGEYEARGNLTMTARADGDLLRGLGDALRESGILIIDDFQNMLNTDNMPPGDLFECLRRISSRGGPGKVLLITNETLAPGRWEDDIPTHTFPTPTAEEAVAVLSYLLTTNDVAASVPKERRSDVARWLGYNPRAMQILSACLRFDTLDRLIALEPSAWETKDQFLSQQLIDRLELRIAQQILVRLDSSACLLLDNLSILRRPFLGSAIERQSSMIPDYQGAKERLASLFILGLDAYGKFSVNSVVRQVVRHRVETLPSVRRRAHRLAADYYSRHFNAIGESGRLHGQEFVEARYHLVALGAVEELEGLTRKFQARQLKQFERATIAVPDDQERVTELLITLAAVLADIKSPAPRLRVLLARLCVKRGLPGDDILALNQLRIATVASRDEGAWVLYFRLLGELEGAPAVARATRSLPKQLASVATVHIFTTAAQIIARSGDLALATDVAREGVARAPVVNFREKVFAHQVLAGLMLRAGEYAPAMDMLDDLRTRIDPNDLLYNRVVEGIAFPSLARHDIARIKHLMEEIPNVARRVNEKILCQALLAQCADNFSEAAALLKTAESSYVAAVTQRAFCHLVAGEVSEADTTLALWRGRAAASRTMSWLEAVVHMKCGRDVLAVESLRRISRRASFEIEPNDPYLWIHVWDEITSDISDYPAFYFPRLPAVLTGLGKDLIRLESMDTALRNISLESRLVTLQETSDLVTLRAGGDAPPGSGALNPTVNLNIINAVSAAGRGGIHMSDEYTVTQSGGHNQVGSIGQGSTASGVTQGSSVGSFETLDLKQLAADLHPLVATLRERVENEDQMTDLEILISAQTAAANGNRDGAKSRLARLSTWAVGAATAIGTGLTTIAIKSATGM
jgi:hypothetical protein